MNISTIRQKNLMTAIKTPFNHQGDIDLAVYDGLVKQQIEAGVNGLIVGGTTGEGHLLGWDEHLLLISHTVKHYGEHLLIVGNPGSNNTRKAIKASESGFACGMHAALQINPYYGKTSPLGVKKHLEACLDIGPAFIYNVPSRTGQDILPETVYSLATHQNFIGMKECTGNERISQYERQGIACWSGNDDESFEARHQCSAHGVISVSANIIPKLMKKLMLDKNKASLNQSLQPFFKWLFNEPNPIAINTALSMSGAIKPVFRLPYLPLDISARRAGIALLKVFDDNDRVGESLSILKDSDFNLLV